MKKYRRIFFFVYNRNGSRFSVVRDDGVARRAPGVVGVPLSDASEGFRSNLDTAVCWPERTGVVLPDGVLCLPLGVRRPVGVRGRDPPLGVVRPSLLAFAAARAVDVRVFVTFLIGMRDGVPASSVLSRDRLDPCLEGGFDPALDPGLEPGRDPPGVNVDLPTLGFLYLLPSPLAASLSLRESGVPALRDDLEALPAGPAADIGTDRAVRSLTLVIGPVVGGVFVLERGVRGLNAAMLCDTPSARMNCSRSSMLVRPLALQGSFLTRNSSSATQPPPTLTITVDRRIRTSRNF